MGNTLKAYYSCESFGLVAATVNVGFAATSFSYINGLQARFQAHTKALVELADVVQFPDAHDTLKLIPDW
ncbi:hypothetical protein [Paraburkholderia sp. GAS348]|uniref:hypothetical protein n=1 Tax=Paraburkholderia sp. GAS348 TaxID=3035132 RepID=UPI003D1E7E8F